MKKSFLIVAALLGSTALAAPGFAQDAPPQFTLSGTGGVIGINMPNYDTGAFGHVAGGNMFGGMIGFSGQATVGSTGDWGVVLGINAFGSFGVGMSTWTDAITTRTTITGLDSPSPAPTFTLNATTPGTAQTDITGAGGGINNQTATTGGNVNAGGVVQDATGFEVVAGAVTAGSSAGFVANGDKTGGILVGESTDGSLKIKTDVTRSIFYGGADLTLGMAGTFDSATRVQVYAGPSVRALSQGIVTAFTADVTETQPSLGVVLPTFTIALNDQLMSTYLGGVFGGNVSFQAQPGVTFILGAEGGVYSVHSSWNEHDTYSTCCGTDPALGASQSLSVDGPTHTADLGSRAAFSAKASAGATWDLDGNKSIGVTGNVGYLSAVPNLSHAGLVNGVGTPTTTFSWGSMITYGIAATFTGHF